MVLIQTFFFIGCSDEIKIPPSGIYYGTFNGVYTDSFGRHEKNRFEKIYIKSNPDKKTLQISSCENCKYTVTSGGF